MHKTVPGRMKRLTGLQCGLFNNIVLLSFSLLNVYVTVTV